LARVAPFALALIAGLLQAIAVADPWAGRTHWWLQLLSLAVLAGQLARARGAAQAALLGGVYATSWLCGIFWWLFISMHVYGGLPSPMAAAAVLLLAGFLALYYALAAGLYRRWLPAAGGARALLFAALWLGAELMRAGWFTGFPWGAGGYAHVDGPLAVLAPWVGVHGIGAVAAWGAALLAQLVDPRRQRSGRPWLGIALAGLVLTACNVVGRATPGPEGDPVQVALLQGNIPQDEKFQGGTGIPLALDWYGRLLADTPADLVVAPETAIPMLPQQLPQGYLEAIGTRLKAAGRAALVGIPLGSYEQGYTNSVIALGPVPEYRYDKHHLVPFGEFIPPLFRWFTAMMNIPLGDFNRGAVGQASFVWRGQRFAPNVCYEDLFGEELAARFADPASAPTIFVNVSNIAWFGDTVAIDQHLHISRMRALEFDRPLIRATNTGATAIVDRTGRVTHLLPRHTRGVLTGPVHGGTGITPYAQWVSRLGLWPLWGLVLAAAALAALAARRR